MYLICLPTFWWLNCPYFFIFDILSNFILCLLFISVQACILIFDNCESFQSYLDPRRSPARESAAIVKKPLLGLFTQIWNTKNSNREERQSLCKKRKSQPQSHSHTHKKKKTQTQTHIHRHTFTHTLTSMHTIMQCHHAKVSFVTHSKLHEYIN